MTTYGSDAGPPSQARPATDTAREQAGRVGETAADAGRDVATTTREEAGEVTREARRQARNLATEARQATSRQLEGEQHRLAKSLHSLSDELNSMADRSDQHGMATELARQAAAKAQDFAGYLDQREPGDLIEEVREFARRRPGTFLLGALAAGVAVGRLTRGAASAKSAESTGASQGISQPVSRPASQPGAQRVTEPPSGGPQTLQQESLAQPGGPGLASTQAGYRPPDATPTTGGGQP
jgi:hypothetical protein